jgi:hypothetical protein
MYLRRALEVKRFVLISPELLLVLLVVLAYRIYPEWFEAIATPLREDKGLPSFIGGLPFALVIASYKLGMAILRPGDEEENKILYEWPLYWAVESRVYGSIIACVLCCVASVLFYLNPANWSTSASGALLVGSILIASITVFTLLIGKMKLRKLMTLYR